MYYLSKQFSNEFMVSICSPKSSSIQHDFDFQLRYPLQFNPLIHLWSFLIHEIKMVTAVMPKPEALKCQSTNQWVTSWWVYISILPRPLLISA